MPIPWLARSVHELSCGSTHSSGGAWATITQKFMMRKARKMHGLIRKHLQGKILDIGMGAGCNLCYLKQRGHKVTGVDVADLSIYDDLKPVIYDGNRLPFRKDEFEVALLIHVLHHCQSPQAVLAEAKRVAKRVIFIEDTYRNWLERLWVSGHDQIGNWEFKDHPYQTMEQWRRFIAAKKWRVVEAKSWWEINFSPFGSRYCLFVVE